MKYTGVLNIIQIQNASDLFGYASENFLLNSDWSLDAHFETPIARWCDTARVLG